MKTYLKIIIVFCITLTASILEIEAKPVRTPIKSLIGQSEFKIQDLTHAHVIDACTKKDVPIWVGLAIVEKETLSGLLSARDAITENDNHKMLCARTKAHGKTKALKMISAYGAMQVLGSTAEMLGYNDYEKLAQNNAYQIEAGVSYLAYLRSKGYSWDQVIKRYNGSGYKAEQYKNTVLALGVKYKKKYS